MKTRLPAMEDWSRETFAALPCPGWPTSCWRESGKELIQPMRAPKLTAWREVEGFYIWRVRGNKFVAYRRTGAASLMGKVDSIKHHTMHSHLHTRSNLHIRWEINKIDL